MVAEKRDRKRGNEDRPAEAECRSCSKLDFCQGGVETELRHDDRGGAHQIDQVEARPVQPRQGCKLARMPQQQQRGDHTEQVAQRRHLHHRVACSQHADQNPHQVKGNDPDQNDTYGKKQISRHGDLARTAHLAKYASRETVSISRTGLRHPCRHRCTSKPRRAWRRVGDPLSADARPALRPSCHRGGLRQLRRLTH